MRDKVLIPQEYDWDSRLAEAASGSGARRRAESRACARGEINPEGGHGDARYLAPAERITEHPCLVPDVGMRPQRWELQRARTRVTVDVTGPLHSNNPFLLLAACKSGAGIALLPASVVGAEVREGRLRHVLPPWLSTEQGIYAVYPSARFIPGKVRAFVEFVAAGLRAGAG